MDKELDFLKEKVDLVVEAIKKAYYAGGKVLVCGNGGSCSDADHIVGELMKGFLSLRPMKDEEKEKILSMNFDNGERLTKALQRGIPAYSLNTHAAVISAIINDIGADMMFAQQVFASGTEKDVLIGISTGGNAENVCNALKIGKSLGLTTVGMTGNKQGKICELSDILIDVPSSETYKIQEYHIQIYHEFCAKAEKDIFG